jgi:hypothetical protein
MNYFINITVYLQHEKVNDMDNSKRDGIFISGASLPSALLYRGNGEDEEGAI